jgi:hypothetical protein
LIKNPRARAVELNVDQHTQGHILLDEFACVVGLDNGLHLPMHKIDNPLIVFLLEQSIIGHFHPYATYGSKERSGSLETFIDSLSWDAVRKYAQAVMNLVNTDNLPTERSVLIKLVSNLRLAPLTALDFQTGQLTAEWKASRRKRDYRTRKSTVKVEQSQRSPTRVAGGITRR